MKIDYSNQTDIFNPERWIYPVHVIGAGGIGSAVLFPLMKVGVHEIHVWDRDDVEPHNIPAQLLYRTSDIGTSKVDAVCEFAARQEVQCKVVPHNEFVSEGTLLEGVVISGVDSMTSRHAIWEAVKFNVDVPLYMDGRIGGEAFGLYTLNPSVLDEIDAYENTLFSDEEAAQLPCAARTVIHPPTVLAGHIVANLTHFARGIASKSSFNAHLKSTQFLVGKSQPVQ
jgi:hypothetical protein